MLPRQEKSPGQRDLRDERPRLTVVNMTHVGAVAVPHESRVRDVCGVADDGGDRAPDERRISRAAVDAAGGRALSAAVMLLEVLEHADADTLGRHRENITRVLREALCSVATEGEA